MGQKCFTIHGHANLSNAMDMMKRVLLVTCSKGVRPSTGLSTLFALSATGLGEVGVGDRVSKRATLPRGLQIVRV